MTNTNPHQGSTSRLLDQTFFQLDPEQSKKFLDMISGPVPEELLSRAKSLVAGMDIDINKALDDRDEVAPIERLANLLKTKAPWD